MLGCFGAFSNVLLYLTALTELGTEIAVILGGSENAKSDDFQNTKNSVINMMKSTWQKCSKVCEIAQSCFLVGRMTRALMKNGKKSPPVLILLFKLLVVMLVINLHIVMQELNVSDPRMRSS